MRNPFVTIDKALAERGAPKRSSHWPAIRRAHLAIEGWCRGCGRISNLEVHHCEPFHINPSRELDPTNLLTLCEAIGHQCHLKLGHHGNWRKFNPDARKQCCVPNPRSAPGAPSLTFVVTPPVIRILLAFILCLLTACTVTRYQAGDHKFVRATLGTNVIAQQLFVMILPDGTRTLMLGSLNQNQSEASKSIAEGVTTALTRSLRP